MPKLGKLWGGGGSPVEWDSDARAAYTQAQAIRAGSIPVALGEHWLVLGMTGAGKTKFVSHLTKALIQSYQVPQYILDMKPAEEFDHYPGLIRSEAPPPLIEKGQQVWRPGLDPDARGTFDILNAWFTQLLTYGEPCIVWINELAAITKGESNPVAPEQFTRLMKLAREFGITVICETQELSKIPASAKKQASHVIRFMLSPAAPYDQRIGWLLAGINPKPGLAEPKRFAFWHRQIASGEPGRFYRSYHDFF